MNFSPSPSAAAAGRSGRAAASASCIVRRRTARRASPSNTGTTRRTAGRTRAAARRGARASSRRAPASRSGRRATGRRGSSSVSNGHTAQNGTTAIKPSFWQTTRSPACVLAARVVDEQRRPVRGGVARAGAASSAAASLGSASVAQIWPCGCGFEQPITVALVLEHLHPAVARAQRRRLRGPGVDHRRDVGAAPSRPASDRGAARSRRRGTCRRSRSARNSGSPRRRQPRVVGVGCSAAKSLSNTNVCS